MFGVRYFLTKHQNNNTRLSKNFEKYLFFLLQCFYTLLSTPHLSTVCSQEVLHNALQDLVKATSKRCYGLKAR